MHVSDPVVGGIEYKGGGEWVLPDGPGIGADFDPAFLDEMAGQGGKPIRSLSRPEAVKGLGNSACE